MSPALPPKGAIRTCGVDTVTLQNGLVTEKVTAKLGEETGLGQLLSQTRLSGQANRLQCISG